MGNLLILTREDKMPVSLPYLASPGSLKNALEKIRSAATPDRVTNDFMNTKLQIKGGTGAALIPYLKKIGFVASDGTPTEIYKRFRNPSSGGHAAADAVKFGYKEMSDVNEYFYDLGEKELTDLIVQVTGLEKANKVTKLTFSTLKNLKSFANFEATENEENEGEKEVNNNGNGSKEGKSHNAGFNLSYTINLNLPATSDQAVFNAIFKSLKEHLLND